MLLPGRPPGPAPGTPRGSCRRRSLPGAGAAAASPFPSPPRPPRRLPPGHSPGAGPARSGGRTGQRARRAMARTRGDVLFFLLLLFLCSSAAAGYVGLGHGHLFYLPCRSPRWLRGQRFPGLPPGSRSRERAERRCPLQPGVSITSSLRSAERQSCVVCLYVYAVTFYE